jgi:hypothetical protein
MPITSAPPIKRTPAAPKPAAKTSRTEIRTEAIGGLGQIAQAILVATRQYADAGAVGMYFPNVAAEVAKLADHEEKIARLIDPLLQVGPYTGLLAAVLPFAMQIAVNHGRIQPGVMGTVPADMLDAQMQTVVTKAAVEAKRAQKAAEAELKRIQAETATV